VKAGSPRCAWRGRQPPSSSVKGDVALRSEALHGAPPSAHHPAAAAAAAAARRFEFDAAPDLVAWDCDCEFKWPGG